MSDIKDKKKNIKVNDTDYVESNSKPEKKDIKSSKSTNGIVYIILTCTIRRIINKIITCYIFRRNIITTY